jgi:hypothetical protein
MEIRLVMRLQIEGRLGLGTSDDNPLFNDVKL